MRLTPDQRRLIGDAVARTNNKSLVARVFGIDRKTVRKWSKRRKHLKDRKRKPKKPKVTLEIELSVLGMRTLFSWGTDRIKKGLMNLPPFMRGVLPNCIQGASLSRPTINKVLRKHKLNGYERKSEGWKFFRAEKPNELWQLDPKGPVTIQGKKYWFVICIDDYSRYVLAAAQLNHEPSTPEIGQIIQPYVKKHKPEGILTDNSPFKDEWDNWCKENGIEPLHAHPYYPQDKGKVERTIRNFTEEFINLIKKFPDWLKGKIKPYKNWFNHKRYHNGIQNYPAKLYLGLRKFT